MPPVVGLDIPEIVFTQGLPGAWESFPQYLGPAYPMNA